MASATEIMQLCRLCLVKDRVNVPIFHGNGDDREISLKISTCLPVKVSQDDNLPKKICDPCSCKLDSLYEFWNTSASSEKQLLEWLSQGDVNVSHSMHTDEIVLKQEAVDIDDTQDDDYTGDDDLNVPTDPDYLLQVATNTSNVGPPATITSTETDVAAAPKRKRRAASMKPLPREVNSDEEDVEEVGNKIAKTEQLSDDEDASENPHPTTFVGLPTDNELPGPSGVETTTVTETPSRTINKMKEIKFFDLPNWAKEIQETDCYVCFKKFNDVYAMRRHLRRNHTAVKMYKCPLCPSVFKSNYELKNHSSVHIDTAEFECDVCMAKFKTKRTLSHHKRRHDTEFAVTCPMCQKGFYYRSELKAHVERYHDDASHKCEVCGKTFKAFAYMKEHAKIHDENREKNRRFKCTLCEKAYFRRRELRLHMTVHTGEKKFMCDVCGRKFAKSDKLKLHRRVHDGLKPVECHECGKRFSTKLNLIVHIRSHTGEKPYKCQFCPKAFTQRPPLVVHMRGHTGERPYGCDLCNKRFITKHMLRLHRQKKHMLA